MKKVELYEEGKKSQQKKTWGRKPSLRRGSYLENGFVKKSINFKYSSS